jgi:hypothetical protein
MPIEEPPMYRAAVEVGFPIKNAAAWNKSTTLTRHANRIEASVNEIHEVISLKY